MKKYIFLFISCFIIVFMSLSPGMCQTVLNGSFDGTTANWNNCSGGTTNLEMGYTATWTDGGYLNSTTPPYDYVAEIDNGNSPAICQTISGFTSGASASSTPNLYMNYVRRIRPIGDAPATVGLQVCLIDPNDQVTASHQVCTTITDASTSFTGYAQLNWDFATPLITSGTSLILSIKSVSSYWSGYTPTHDNYGMVVSYVDFTAPTPVTLVNFKAVKNGSAVDLDWQTATEINNDYFVVEKSRNGVDFTAVGTVDGAGNSQSMLSYQTTDHSPYNGISYYRLKQVDYDGKFSYSRIVSVRNEESEISIYPNPSSGSFNLTMPDNKETYNLEVRDTEGRLVYQKAEISGGSLIEEIKGLSKGVYILILVLVISAAVIIRKLVVL